MQAVQSPGRPSGSSAPRQKSPRKIAPAKQAAKGRAEATKAKQQRVQESGEQKRYSESVRRHFETINEAQRQRKTGPSAALDPARAENTPMQKAKGNRKTKNRAMQLMRVSALAIMSHPFGTQLASWATGVAVDCGAEWAREAVDLAVERGPHPTARAAEAVKLVHEDIAYQVKAGFTEVVFWDEIKDDLPAHFKVSPVAVIPQTGRRGRIILDLSFPVRRPPMQGSKKRRMGEVIQDSVNDTTEKLAPSKPVHEIGQVLPRLFQFMATTPEDQEIRLSKVDLSDGFWRLIVEPEQKWNFCYVMPDPPGARVRIVVPSALQMGWAESPAYFCTATETGRDVIDFLLKAKVELPEHPLEKFMKPNDTPRTSPAGEEYTSIGVYVDDFVIGVVENEDRTLIQRVSRATLHAIHAIFPPPEVSGHVGGKDPISRKKLEKGDARFDVEKEILGFMLNGVDRTVWLAEAKAQAIAEEISKVLRKSRVPLKRFRSLMGRLQHAARILPAAKGMFSPLNKATKGEPKEVGLGKQSETRAALLDLRHIILSLASRPTHVSELVEYEPELAGTCDASSAGAGGVWIGHGVQPTVWRIEWPRDVVAQYKQGQLTNSDLEMAAVLAQYLVAEQLRPMERCHTAIWSDNSPATSWSTKMADKATTPIAGQLLRALAMRQRTTRAALPTVTHYAGACNLLADTASRSFQRFNYGKITRGQPSVCDAQFLTSFDLAFPLSCFSKWQSWKLVTLESEMSSRVISTLRGQKLPMPRWTGTPVPPTGRTGADSAAGLASTASWRKPLASKELMYSWLSLPESVLELLVAANKSGASPLPRPCDMSPKPLFWHSTMTPEKTSTVPISG
jgi:hypothetical protein